MITPDHVDRILSTLLDTYDQVVIDTGSWLDERTLRAFEHAENVLFVVNPEIAALKAINALIEYLNEAGTVAAKSTFILNNIFGREILKLERRRAARSGRRSTRSCRTTPFLYLKAVNDGHPVVLDAPKSRPGRTPAGALGVGVRRRRRLDAAGVGREEVGPLRIPPPLSPAARARSERGREPGDVVVPEQGFEP